MALGMNIDNNIDVYKFWIENFSSILEYLKVLLLSMNAVYT